MFLTNDGSELQSESLIYSLYSVDFVRSKVKDVVLEIVEKHNGQIAIEVLEEKLPNHS